MSYRDELSATRARLAVLEGELEEERGLRKELGATLESARKELARLEASPAVKAAAALDRASAAAPAAPRKLGSAHYHPPRTYVPLITLFGVGLRAVWNRRPRGIGPFNSDRLAVQALRYALLPFYYALWIPYFWFSFLVVTPLTLLLVALGTVLLLPAITASRLTNSAKPPPNESGWFHGTGSESDGAALFAISGYVVPIFVPFSLALADAE